MMNQESLQEINNNFQKKFLAKINSYSRIDAKEIKYQWNLLFTKFINNSLSTYYESRIKPKKEISIFDFIKFKKQLFLQQTRINNPHIEI